MTASDLALQQAGEAASGSEGQPAAAGWLKGLAVGVALPALLALGWEVAVRAGVSNGRLVPPPSRILATLVDLWRTGDLVMHIVATLRRVALGFAFGAVAGTILGGISGASAMFRRLTDPMFQGFRSVPSIAWVPLFVLWFGIFEAPKVMLIAVGVFFPVYLGVLGAIQSVDRKLVEVGQVFRLSQAQMLRRILLPAILPSWAVALRSGLGLGFMFVVAAELMGASEGLGYLLVDGQQLGKPDQIVAAIIVFALLGKIADAVLVRLSAPLLAWQDTARPAL